MRYGVSFKCFFFLVVECIDLYPIRLEAKIENNCWNFVDISQKSLKAHPHCTITNSFSFKLHFLFVFFINTDISFNFTFFFYIFLKHYRLLRAELHSLRWKGALKTGAGSLDRPSIESNRTCSRCRAELGRIINRGAPCRSCRMRVCKSCREFATRTTDWLCIVCHKQMWVMLFYKIKQKLLN